MYQRLLIILGALKQMQESYIAERSIKENYIYAPKEVLKESN